MINGRKHHFQESILIIFRRCAHGSGVAVLLVITKLGFIHTAICSASIDKLTVGGM